MTRSGGEARSTWATIDYEQTPPLRPARQEPLLTHAIPVAAELPRYRGPSARRDAVAGVTVAALAIPRLYPTLRRPSSRARTVETCRKTGRART